MKISLKISKTIKEYKVKAFGYDIVVPVGSHVSNNTAMGRDDNYRFWGEWAELVEKLTGYKGSMLAHDIEHYGINIPAEFC